VRIRLLVAKYLLIQARFAFGGIVLACVVIGFSMCLPPPKGSHLAGLILQLVGILCVVWGLVDLFPLFGRPRLLKSVGSWFSEWKYVVVTRPPISARGFAAVEGADGMRAYGYVGLSRKGSTEEQLKAVQDQLEHISKGIAGLHAKVDGAIGELKAAVTREAKDRQAADEKIEAQLEQTFLDGIQLEFVGASYVFIGTLLSSLPLS
jgi:hypothetical protein